MKRLLIGVSGSIAAHKATRIVEELSHEYEVHVVLTKSASEFVSPLTLKLLSKNEVYIEVFDGDHDEVTHIELVRNSDLILIAPASANTIGKYAAGIGDNMLTSALFVADPSKVIIAPAMNEKMYLNPIVQRNINTLKEFGVKEIPPVECLLANGDYGLGGLAPLEELKKVIRENI